MKHALAIVLIFAPALLAAQKSCDQERSHRVELVRVLGTAPSTAWQEATVDQQIL